MDVNTFNSLYLQKLINLLKETPNKIYLLCSQNCPNLNHHILKYAEVLETMNTITISKTSSVATSLEIPQHTTKLKTKFIIKDNKLCLEFSTNLVIPDKNNFIFPILSMDKIHKQVRSKAIPALTKIGTDDELSLTTLFLMKEDISLKHYIGHKGWPCFSSTPIIFKEESEGLFVRDVDHIIDHITINGEEDDVESDSDGFGIGLPPYVSQPSGKLRIPSFLPSNNLDKTHESDWIKNFHAPLKIDSKMNTIQLSGVQNFFKPFLP